MNIITPKRIQDLAVCNKKLESVGQETMTDSNSQESRELAVREALWQEEQAYYHDRFIYDDRF
ncbi:hypothetical protein H6G33_25125 [Calothrix sp. FACHB-1219]|nr:hypothetical protein [Calothrix sp. FACHB-168]MBD2220292.1 hypothetical protein [Calothrix sp. FACHB-1219]